MIHARETRHLPGKTAPLWKSAAVSSSSSGLRCYSAAAVGQTVPSPQGSFRISCSCPADRLQCLGKNYRGLNSLRVPYYNYSKIYPKPYSAC